MKFIGGIEEGSRAKKFLFGIGGVVMVLGIWVALTTGSDPVFTSGILPSPWRVLLSFRDLFNHNELLRNAGLSISLNLGGYLEAISIAIPVGFIIGLIKYTRWGFHRQIDAIRYIPLTALTGVFIVWFGIGAPMKIHFLAFGILIYLLPIIVQRIDEVQDVYLKTVHTLGASDWQILKTVYFPSVISRLSDDIRVLTAISWTYIIVAETLGSQGGIGDLIWKAGFRQGRIDKVFAILIIIMLIGVIQDKVFIWLDRQLFPHKYQARESIKSSKIQQVGLLQSIADFAFLAIGWIVAIIYFILLCNEFIPFLAGFKPLSYLFGDTVWVIHIVYGLAMLFIAFSWWRKRSNQVALEAITPKTGGS